MNVLQLSVQRRVNGVAYIQTAAFVLVADTWHPVQLDPRDAWRRA